MDTQFNQQVLETILDGNPGMAFILNLETEALLYSSINISTISGYSLEEAKAMDSNFIDTVIHEDDRPRIREVLQAIRNSKLDQTSTVEYRLLPKNDILLENGHPYCTSYLRPMERNAKNEVLKVCGISIQIHALKLTQLEIERKNHILSNIAKFNPAHVIITDAATNLITYSSRLLEDILGYTVIEDQDSLSLYEIVGQIMIPDDFIKLIKVWQDMIEFGKPAEFQTEIRLYGLHKEFRWFRYTCAPYECDSIGNVKSLIHYATEITKWKEAELELETTNIELEQFIYISSHDLKQPLNTIESSLKLLLLELKNYEHSTNIMDAIDTITNKTKILKGNIQSVLK